MNQHHISYYLTGAISITLLLMLLLIILILQFRKKHSWFSHLTGDMVKGFKLQLLYTEANAQEAVFKNIAREIHDNIGLSLTTLKLFLTRLISGAAAETSNEIRGSVGLLSRVIDQLRNISRSMNGDVLEDQGLVNALQQEIERINQLHQLRFELRLEGEQVNFAPVREISVLRITQELINNTLKHAKASVATILLHYAEDHLFLRISDNGIGIGTVADKKQKGSGLINIFKRIEMLEGCCTISNNSPQGTTIDISIPLNQ